MAFSRIRHLGEIALPGLAIGALAGGLAGLLAVLVGQPSMWTLATVVGLGVPLALFGAGHSLLVGRGVLQPGVFAPAGLYWMVGFPLARLVHEMALALLVTGRLQAPEALLAFLGFQALVSFGYAIGFVWLHERITPWWLLKVQDRNPQARRLFAVYVGQAEAMWQSTQQGRANRAKRQEARGPTSSRRGL